MKQSRDHAEDNASVASFRRNFREKVSIIVIVGKLQAFYLIS